MPHDLIHIQGKPYMVVPLHEYRQMTASQNTTDAVLPSEIMDALAAGQIHPVKILRHHRGMTQDDLAKASGISRPYLTEIETGKKEGSIGAIKSIAEALKVSAGLLL